MHVVMVYIYACYYILFAPTDTTKFFDRVLAITEKMCSNRKNKIGFISAISTRALDCERGHRDTTAFDFRGFSVFRI